MHFLMDTLWGDSSWLSSPDLNSIIILNPQLSISHNVYCTSCCRCFNLDLFTQTYSYSTLMQLKVRNCSLITIVKIFNTGNNEVSSKDTSVEGSWNT